MENIIKIQLQFAMCMKQGNEGNENDNNNNKWIYFHFFLGQTDRKTASDNHFVVED